MSRPKTTYRAGRTTDEVVVIATTYDAVRSGLFTERTLTKLSKPARLFLESWLEANGLEAVTDYRNGVRVRKRAQAFSVTQFDALLVRFLDDRMAMPAKTAARRFKLSVERLIEHERQKAVQAYASRVAAAGARV